MLCRSEKGIRSIVAAEGSGVTARHRRSSHANPPRITEILQRFPVTIVFTPPQPLVQLVWDCRARRLQTRGLTLSYPPNPAVADGLSALERVRRSCIIHQFNGGWANVKGQDQLARCIAPVRLWNGDLLLDVHGRHLSVVDGRRFLNIPGSPIHQESRVNSHAHGRCGGFDSVRSV